MATGHWLTNRGKNNLLLGRGTSLKVALLIVQPAALDTQAEVADMNTVTDVIVTAGATECSVGGYARQAVASFTRTEDDTNDRVNMDVADIAFGALTTGQTIVGALWYDATTDTNDTTREAVSIDWFAAGVPTNGGTFTYAVADMYRLS